MMKFRLNDRNYRRCGSVSRRTVALLAVMALLINMSLPLLTSSAALAGMRHSVTFHVAGDGQILVDDAPVGDEPLSVEGDSLAFSVAPVRSGADVVVEAEGGTLTSEGGHRYTLSGMAEAAAVTATVTDRLNAVEFRAAEGIHALVDGVEVARAKAVNGTLRFAVAADEGFTVSAVNAENLGDARLTGNGDDYILTNVADDGIVIDIAADAEAPRTDFSYQDKRVVITAIADEEASLPQSAELKADYMAPGTPAYAEMEAAVRAAYGFGDDVVLNLAPYDIYFLDGDRRIEPEEGKVRVSIPWTSLPFPRATTCRTSWRTANAASLLPIKSSLRRWAT